MGIQLILMVTMLYVLFLGYDGDTAYTDGNHIQLILMVTMLYVLFTGYDGDTAYTDGNRVVCFIYRL